MEVPPCADLPSILYYEERPPGFEQRLEEVQAAEFRRLFRCRLCAQHWRVDDWDKYQVQFAVKITDPSLWRTYDASALQKELLLRGRGGVSTAECTWANCPNRAVAQMAVCVDHLWNSGVRR